MNPFRRLWTRELGLYATALAILVQILMAVAHTAPGHAGELDRTYFCTVDTGAPHDPAAMAETCPLCHIPNPLVLKPRDPTPTAALDWTAIVYAPAYLIAQAQADFVNPPARGPPSPA